MKCWPSRRATFDADTRWALAWFEQSGFDEGAYGVAETLSKAKNTSIAGIVEGGILASSGGKVRLLRPDELADDWDPTTDARLTVWETVHRLIRAQETGGEMGAARLVARLGAWADVARELAYRLYTVCERKKRSAEALSYNGLVQSWPEITRLARSPEQGRAALRRGTGVTAWLSRTKIAHVGVCIQHLFAISRRIAQWQERLTWRLCDPRQYGLRPRSRKLPRQDSDLANRGKSAEW